MIAAIKRWFRIHSGLGNPGHPPLPETGKHYLSHIGYDG